MNHRMRQTIVHFVFSAVACTAPCQSFHVYAPFHIQQISGGLGRYGGIRTAVYGRGRRTGTRKKGIEKTSGKNVKKGDLPTKICVVCQRPFTWRKKWERCWEEVTCCSKKCQSQRRSGSKIMRRIRRKHNPF
mmetsp:Transcript_21280/g.27472  ORF Transcript_21280/g.27472 Transcript_21280/m.27472 type:complete len:132 (-) Transcript_21280:81-476(-)